MNYFLPLEGTTRLNAFQQNLFVIVIGFTLACAGSVQAIETQIAFSSDRDGNLEIYTIDTDGANLVRLTNHPARTPNLLGRPTEGRLPLPLTDATDSVWKFTS